MTVSKKDPLLAAIYGAIWDLNTFAVRDAARLAGTSLRQFANVVDALEKEEILQVDNTFHPLVFYRLSKDPEKRNIFLERLVQHKEPVVLRPDTELIEKLIGRMHIDLEKIRSEFNKVADKSIESIDQRMVVDLFNSAGLFLQDAVFESGFFDRHTNEFPADHPVKNASDELQRVKTMARELGYDF